MDALSYEHLIRMAYNCDADGAGGRAEKSIYLKMEEIENAIKESASIDLNGDIAYIYRSASMNLSMNVYEALMKVIEDFAFTDENKKFKKRLKKLADDIYMKTDRKIIDSIIEKALQIFKQIKLKMK